MEARAIKVLDLIQQQHSDGLIISKKGVRTIVEFFPSQGAETPFAYKWQIPVWMQFSENTILDFSGIDIIIPTASEMLCDVIDFHRRQGIDIYVANLDRNEILWAKQNNFEIKYWQVSDS